MTPGRVSILIPARHERFLAATIRDVLAKAAGDIEVQAVLDGCWADPPLPDDSRVHVIHVGAPQGMRPAINRAARLATGEFLMKLDGHCMVADGFDVSLKADYHERNWVVVPRRYALEPESWTVDESNAKYPIDQHYLSYPYERPGDPRCGLHGTAWVDRSRARRAFLLDDEMSSQGSCWFMHRDHWARLGDLDVARYGNFIQEFQEIGNKTWLGGGAVKVNKQTWYAHLYKGKRYGRGYSMDGFNHVAGRDFCTDYWMHDRWPQRVRDLRWLIERFSPVPGWPADLDEAFRPRVKRVETTSATVPGLHEGATWIPVTDAVLSYCVPCHRRTDDLVAVLPSVIAAANASPPVEIVVVDYGEQEPLEPLLEPHLSALQTPNRLVVVPARGRAYFHMAHARNVALRAATGEIVVIGSSDIVPAPAYFAAIRARLAETKAVWLWAAPKYRELFVCRRDELIAAGGYDERMEFYGPEGKDLEARLRRRGQPSAAYSSEHLSVLRTPNDKKLQHYRLPLDKRAMHAHGRAIWDENTARGVLIANAGQDWGAR